MLKKCKFGFDVWALVLFAAVMIPNIIWYFFPAPNDILRNPSATPVVDAAASVFQVIFVALLILFKNTDAPKIKFSCLHICSLVCLAAYFCAWVLYYCGITGNIVILLLSLVPCLAFGFYAAERKNLPALIFIAAFAVCHLLFAVVNFIA